MGNNVLIEILAIKRRFSNYISQLTIKNNYIHIRLYKIFLKKKNPSIILCQKYVEKTSGCPQIRLWKTTKLNSFQLQ